MMTARQAFFGRETLKPTSVGQATILVIFAFLIFGSCFLPSTVHATDADWVTKDDKSYPCSDDENSLYAQMNKNNQAYIAGAIYKANETFRQHKTTSYAACIIKMIDYYDKIKALLSSSLGLLGAVLLGLLTTLLNYVCQYIVSAINALLASVCLPIPRIGFSLSLPGMPSASCDGLSLLNLMQAQGTFTTNIPYSGYMGNMSLGLDQLMNRSGT